jgi:hypothetical protein
MSLSKSFSRGVTILMVAVASAPLLLGCGGDGGASQCGGSASCGGNVVGSWDIAELCTQNASSMVNTGSCPGLQVDASGLHETGSISFQSDLTYSSTAVISGSLSEMIPTACLSSGGVAPSCEQLNTVLQTAVQGDMTFSSASCRSVTGGCACSFQLAPQTATEVGTYSTTGSVLTTSPNTGSASSASYCVQGSTMTVADMSMTGMSGVTASVVLNKK